jgi:hypothetical protein
MSSVLSTTLGSKKVDSAQGNKPEPITYREPTYHLYLSSQPLQNKDVKLKHSPYQSLDHRIDQIVHDKYKDKWSGFSPNRKNKIREDIAHSFAPKVSQKSSMQIQKPLADAQGLSQQVVSRLQRLTTPYNTAADLTPFADLLFSRHQGSDFTELLVARLHTIFGSDPALTPLKNEIFKEVMSIQKEIRQWTDSTMAAIPIDQDFNHIPNGRVNLDGQGHVVYSTGCMDTEQKAHLVIDQLIDHTLSTGKLTKDDLIPQSDGTYLYPVVIDNLLTASPIIDSKEREYLLQQDQIFRTLDGKVKYSRLKNGEVIRLALKPIHFSTQSTYHAFLGQSLDAEKISNQGLNALEEIYSLRKDSLPEQVQQAVEFCLKELPKCSTHERFILRAFICEALNIAYHVQCKKSHDQVAAVVAIKKALHQWIGLENWKAEGGFVIPDPRQFFYNSVFREYSESAFFENLPLTDSFDYQSSLTENSLPALVLSERNLYHASMAERALYTLTMTTGGLILGALYIALSPIILPILYLRFGDQAWEASKYFLLCLTLLPLRSASRQKWLDRDSKMLEQRGFFRTKTEIETPASLKTLFNKIENLSSSQQNNLLRFVKTGEKSYLASVQEHEDILRDICHEWPLLQRYLEENKPLPSCLKGIVKAAPSSPVILFQYLKNFSQKVIFNFLQKTPIAWATETCTDELIRHPPQGGITENFKVDYSRSHYIVQTKHQSQEFPTGYTGDKINDLTKALQKLTVFKGCSTIPYPIQEMLTQKTHLVQIFIPIWKVISPDTLSVPDCTDRRFVIEEGDDSFFWLTVKEKALTKSNSNGANNTISFEYSYTFKISRTNKDDWKATFTTLSPMQPNVEETVVPLLEAAPVVDPSEEVRSTAFNTLMSNLSFNLKALAICSDKESSKQLHLKIKDQLSLLIIVFQSYLFKNTAQLLNTLQQDLLAAEPEKREKIFIQLLTSYLKLLKENERIEILFNSETQTKLLMNLSKESYSKLLKDVLSSANYKQACQTLNLPLSFKTS